MAIFMSQTYQQNHKNISSKMNTLLENIIQTQIKEINILKDL
jgi:uncharacterized protein (DUF305 family)